MRVVSLSTNPSVEQDQTADGLAGRTSVKVGLALEFLPETTEEADWLADRARHGTHLIKLAQELISKTPELQLAVEPISSSLPFIVVSVRPQIDGAPSMSQVVQQGETADLPLALQVIGPDGKLMRISVPLELRASVR